VALTPALKKLFNLPTGDGLLVQRVDVGSAAYKAGIKPGSTVVVVGGESYRVGGDIITSLDGQRVTSPQQLFYAGLPKVPGDKLAITLWHDGKKKSVTVKLGQRAGP